MSEQQAPTDVTSDDKLWAALAYVFSPLVPIILLLLEDKKNRPFIRAHNVQALVTGLVIWIIVPFTLGCGVVVWLVMFFWGYQAYQGQTVNIPVITDLIKNQGWA